MRLIGFQIQPERWEYPDSFWTPHNTSFFLEQDFQDCYKTAVSIAGHDYRIPRRVHQLLWATDSSKHIKGDIVEVGTGRGFMMAAVLKHLDLRSIDKNVYLYDLFEQPKKTNPVKLRFSNFYATSSEEMKQTFSRFPRATLIVGDVYKTLEKGHSNAIALLHLDLNDAEAETFALQSLWQHLQPGAIIILDDYANRGLEEQYDATNRFLKENNAGALVTASGQGIVIKP